VHGVERRGNGRDDPARSSRNQTNLTAQTASGLSWFYVATMTLMVANLAYTATASRLLAPAAFGLMAMANLVVLFMQFFARMGLGSALVQKPHLSEEEIRAASTAGIVVGLACLALVWILAPAVAALFRAPDLPPILRGLGVSFVFMGWSMTGLGLLRREHRFRTLSIITVGTYVFGYLLVGVGLALLGAGVWSLVAASVASTAAQAIWQYAILRHPLRPVLRWEPYQAICGYGARLAGAGLLDYGGGNLDTFTVSRVASTTVLGQYSRAYYLVFQPLSNYVAQALTNVLFSPLSRIQQNLGRLRRAYFSVLSLGNLMLFPICTGIALAAHELVLVVLGPQWGLAAELVPWFALAGGCHVASQLTQLLAEARAELNRSLVVQTAYIVALALLLLMVLPFRSRGVWVVAAAVAAAELLRYVGYLALARRVLGMALARMWHAHVPALFASAGVALAVAATRWALTGHVRPLVVLGAEVSAGALALALCIRFCPQPAVRSELWMRLTAAGVVGAAGGRRWWLASLVLGPPDPLTLVLGPPDPSTVPEVGAQDPPWATRGADTCAL
jgi:O-antigen/teichoic acid export membrane protein